MVDVNEYIKANWKDQSDKDMAACLKVDFPDLTPKAVKNRRHRMKLFRENGVLNYNSQEAAKLLRDIELATEELGQVDKVSVHKSRIEVVTDDGEPEVKETIRTDVTISPVKSQPQWTPVVQARPTIIRPCKITRPKRVMKRAVILPDPQVGFRRDLRTNDLVPFHDETAIATALQIIRHTKPDLIVNLGDFFDFPTFGKFVQEPGFALTVQPSLDAGHRFLAQQRACSPQSKIVFIPGNHDVRLEKAIVQNLGSAFGLHRANMPDEYPVMSIPFLLRFEALGIEYVEGYPAGEYYINDGLKCIHGIRVGRNSTRQTLMDERVSTITGHNHHVEVLWETFHFRDGPVDRMSATLGCLARLDGEVPSFHSSTDTRGNAVRNYENWQHCVGVVDYEEDSSFFALNPVKINNGIASFEGRLYGPE